MSQSTKSDALNIQVGGTHYRGMKIQPVEFAMANRWDFCASCALKYLLRHGDKNGRQDLEKAIHFGELRQSLCDQRWIGGEIIEMRDFITANAVPAEEAAALTALARVVWENSTRAYLELKAAIQHLITVRYGAA